MKRRDPKPKARKAIDDDVEEWMIGQPGKDDNGAKKKSRIRKGTTASGQSESHYEH